MTLYSIILLDIAEYIFVFLNYFLVISWTVNVWCGAQTPLALDELHRVDFSGCSYKFFECCVIREHIHYIRVVWLYAGF